jgi:hypothetical protein
MGQMMCLTRSNEVALASSMQPRGCMHDGQSVARLPGGHE